MKRLAVLCLAALVVAGPAAMAAHAASPAATKVCRDKIINEWEGTGRIKTTYPVACYESALAFVKKEQDLSTYSSIADDIRAALLARKARAAGKTAPSFVGKGIKKHHTTTSANGVVGPGGGGSGGGSGGKGATGPGDGSNGTGGGSSSQLAGSTTGGGSSGTPLPVIILGAIAILLVAAGAIGTGVRYSRRRGTSHP